MDYSVKNPTNNLIYYLIQLLLIIATIVGFVLISAFVYKAIIKLFKLNEGYNNIDQNVYMNDVMGNLVVIPLKNVQRTLAAANAKDLNDTINVPINTIDNNVVQVQLGELRKEMTQHISLPFISSKTETATVSEKTQEDIDNIINGISSETTPSKISKSFYNKFEEINYPSSLDPYISRDTVAYRRLQNDTNFIKDRPYALACQVDLTPNWRLQNYDNTRTNIIRTCVYNDTSNDPDIWTKDKCISECAKIPDMTM